MKENYASIFSVFNGPVRQVSLYFKYLVRQIYALIPSCLVCILSV